MMNLSAHEFRPEQHLPLRLAEIGVAADVTLGTRIASNGQTYRVVGLERVGAVIDWIYLEDLATGAFVEQDVSGG